MSPKPSAYVTVLCPSQNLFRTQSVSFSHIAGEKFYWQSGKLGPKAFTFSLEASMRLRSHSLQTKSK